MAADSEARSRSGGDGEAAERRPLLDSPTARAGREQTLSGERYDADDEGGYRADEDEASVIAAIGGGPAAAAAAAGGTFTRNLGAAEAFAIVVSIVIGSGVFTSPGSIDTNVPSPGAALLVWLVGGVLAWTGASTMAELGTAIPGEGWSSSVSELRLRRRAADTSQGGYSRISSTSLGMSLAFWRPGRG